MRQRFAALFTTTAAAGMLGLLGAAAPSQADAAERYALLVGVTDYPSLDEKLWLTGPANDVMLMEQVLLQSGFSDDHILVLSQGENSEGLPTRDAILGEIDRLIETVQPGDFVYLQFGGHGSQQPAVDDDTELDGMDEIFLPYDVGAWDGRVGAVENAIVDDDMEPRIAALRLAGAFVFAVFDSCHSGTMLRAVNTGETDRRLDPADLGIPDDVLAAAQANAVQTRGGPATERSIFDFGRDDAADAPEMGGYVAFYAAQTTETTPEMRLPAGDPNRQTYGLFSFTIAEVLSGSPGITYRQAAQQILSEYVADRRNAPTPLFESDGPSMDAILLSGTPATELQQWPLTEERGAWRMPAGRLSRIDNGSILAVYDSATAAADAAPLGYVVVESAQVVHSLVTPIAYGDAPVLEDIPRGAFARLVDSQFSVSLTVALPERGDAAEVEAAWGALDALVADGLGNVALNWVDAGEAADMFLHIQDGRIWFLPPSGEIETTGDQTSPYLTIPPAGDQDAVARFVADLEDNLTKAARVSALFSLANQLSATAIGRELTVELEVVRRDGSREEFGVADFPTLSNSDAIRFYVTNTSDQVVDLTALFIDSSYGIEPWFPYQGESNRMNPGETLQSELQVNLTTVGIERFLFIAAAVQPGAARADFSFLAQQGMASRSGRSGTTLNDVLADAGVDVPATRGGGRGGNAASLATMSSFSWMVAP